MQRKHDNLLHTYCAQLLHLYYYFLPFYYSRFPLQSWMILHLRAAGVAAAAAQQWREGESQQQLQSGCGIIAGGRITGIHKLQFDFFRNFVCLPYDTTQFICAIRIQFCRSSLIFCCVFVNLCICICVFVYLIVFNQLLKMCINFQFKSEHRPIDSHK